MIYNESITLTEADEFLESIGVELFETYAVIEGKKYPGSDTMTILEANGIFLYEDCIVVEGKQAEEYLEKKKQAAIKDRENETKMKAKYSDVNSSRNSYRAQHNAPTASNNPKYDTARDMARHRDSGYDIMPKKLTNGEKRYAQALEDEKVLASMSNKYVDRFMNSSRKTKLSDTDLEIAKDAFRRKVRTRHKAKIKESASIFSSIKFV